MRAELQPNVDAEISDCIDGRRKLDRLAHTSAPMLRSARFTRQAVAGDGAEERDGCRPRREIGKRVLQRLGGRLHHRVMEWMIDAHQPREDTLRLQFGEYR